MILIFSNSRDQATNNVMPWLDRYGARWLRLNEDEMGDNPLEVRLTEGEFGFRADGRWWSAADISAIWYRKGRCWATLPAKAPLFDGNPALNRFLERRMDAETRRTWQYFHHLMRTLGVRTLGNAMLGDPNKLVVLHEAQRVGLRIPKFEVTNRLADHHLADPSRYITKAISDGVYLWDVDEAKRGYFSYTEDLSAVLAEVPGRRDIPLSLIQEKVEKSFEVRSFFLEGKFVSTAIYSQEDEQTATDYRKYNLKTPNRNVPMVLPEVVTDRLMSLFERLELNTGSFDMIVDRHGEFVFLEVNPFGIYGSMSAICNFNIDKAIGQWLCGALEDDWAFPSTDNRRTA